MQDLTQGSIHKHLSQLTSVILFGMVFQTLYYLIDLYFVAQAGSTAVAAVSLSGSLLFVTIALSQALTSGTTSLIAQAWGRKDFAEARRIFNQAQVLATGVGALFVAVAFLLRRPIADSLAADAATAQAVLDFLDWQVPAMGVQFLLVAIAAALRGAGEVKLPMMTQLVAVSANIALAPVLIAGWGTGVALGVAGAGLASFLSICLGVALLVFALRRRRAHLEFRITTWRPDFALWRRMLAIGLPTGGEFLLMSVYSTLIYYLIRDFGADAQAGVGVAMRVLQTGFMPAVAVAFSVAPIAGQNFGSGHFDRVRTTWRAGLVWVCSMMLAFMALCHFAPELLIRPFASDPDVIAFGAEMLTIVSFNFLASGVVLVAGGLFQAIGNTLPSLFASMSRILGFAIPAVVIAARPGFQLAELWWLSVGSVLVQLALCLFLLRREMRKRMPAAVAAL
jgi:putative MATE family efflux protein